MAKKVKTEKPKNNPRAFAYAWKLDCGLCHWAEPDRLRLQLSGKPSPEAKIVRVELIEVKCKKRKPNKQP